MSSARFVFIFVLLVAAAPPTPAPAQSNETLSDEARTEAVDSDQGQPGQAQSGETDGTDAGTTGSGETAPSGQTPRKKQYLVEIVTFQYLGPDSSGGEQFNQLMVEEYLPPEPFDYGDYERARQAITYTDMEHLSGTLEKLRLNERYRVMTSLAWIQPLLGRNEAIEVPVGHESRLGASSVHAASQDTAVSHLSGSMRVYGDYLLFVDLDLQVALPAGPDQISRETEADATESGFSSIIGGPTSSGPAAPEDLKMFRISEKRRIKLEEFHYFDHPYFGAIVSVVRYEEEG